MQRGHGRKKPPPGDERQRMIAETSAFLTWAMANPDLVPRLPRRAVSKGGFTQLITQPGARAAVSLFWKRTLDRLPGSGR